MARLPEKASQSSQVHTVVPWNFLSKRIRYLLYPFRTSQVSITEPLTMFTAPLNLFQSLSHLGSPVSYTQSSWVHCTLLHPRNAVIFPDTPLPDEEARESSILQVPAPDTFPKANLILWVKSFIWPFNKYLLNMNSRPGTDQSVAGYITVNQSGEKNPSFWDTDSNE